jgi:hypothetical protein
VEQTQGDIAVSIEANTTDSIDGYNFSNQLGTYKMFQVANQSLVSAWINLISSIRGNGDESIHGDLEENDETLCRNQSSMKMNFW